MRRNQLDIATCELALLIAVCMGDNGVFLGLEFIKTWISPKMMLASPGRCYTETNVARSTADVGEAVLSTNSLAAAFSSVHRDHG
jgi:hypothetical protein